MRCRSGPFNIERIVAGNSWPRAYRIATTTTTEIFDYPSLPDHTHSCIDFARLVGKRTVSTSSSLRAQENIRKTSREVKKEALVKKRLVSDSSPVSPTKHNKGIEASRGTHYEAHDAGASGCSASPHTSSSLDPDPEEVSPSGSHTSSPRRRQIAQARSTPKLVLRKRATDTDTAIIRVANGSHEQTLNEAFFGLQLVSNRGLKVEAHGLANNLQG